MGLFDKFKKVLSGSDEPRDSNEPRTPSFSVRRVPDFSDASHWSPRVDVTPRPPVSAKASQLDYVANREEPLRPLQPVRHPSHEKFAEAYRWFRTPKRAAQYLVREPWDNDELRPLAEWALYAYSDDDIAAVEANFEPPADLYGRDRFGWLVSALLLSQRMPTVSEDLLAPIRELCAQVTRFGADDEDGRIAMQILESLGDAMKQTIDASRFSEELFDFPELVRDSKSLREEAVDHAFSDEARYWSSYKPFGKSFIVAAGQRALDADAWTHGNQIEAAIAVDATPARLFEEMVKTTSMEVRGVASYALRDHPEAVIEHLTASKRGVRFAALDILRNCQLSSELCAEVRRVAQGVDDLRLAVALNDLAKGS